MLMISTVPFGKDGISSVIKNITANIGDSFLVDVVAPRFESPLPYVNETYQLNRRRFLRYFFDLIEIMKKGHYCAVHVHGNSSSMFLELLAASMARIKNRISHAHSTSCKHRILNAICRPLLNRLSTFRIACGEKVGRWLYKKKSFEVINNFIDLTSFSFNQNKREAIRKMYGVCDDDIVLLHIGRFDENKNQIFIAKLLKESKFDRRVFALLIGEGDTADSIKEFTLKNNINGISFLGPKDEVASYYSAADIFLLPSMYEGFPITLVEAQACGLQCVVSDTVSKEVDLSGLVSFAPLNSPFYWIERINELSAPSKRDEISQRVLSILKCRGFDSKVEIQKLASIYVGASQGGNDEKNL